jgi:hypothetical protein
MTGQNISGQVRSGQDMVYIYRFTNFGNKYYRSEIDMTGQSISGRVRSGQDMMNIYNFPNF